MKKIKKIKNIGLIAGATFLGIGCLVSVGTIIGLTVKEKTSDSIFFANYESYMDNNLIKSLEKENNVTYKTYGTTEQLEASFKENYDIAIPTTYSAVKLAKKGQLQKIDWAILGQYTTDKSIKNAEDALRLFADPVQKIIKSYDIDGDGKEDNLLEYGVPYFAQQVVFGYKAKYESEINPSSLNSWTDIFNKLNSLGNLRNGSIVALNDARTTYGLAQLYHGEENVNPNKDETIEQFKSKYQFLSKFEDKMIFKSDSGEVLNTLANPDGKEYSILFNGDLIYAMQGGDDFSNTGGGADLGFKKVDNSVIAVDMLVINKNAKQSKEELYKALSKVGLGYQNNPDGYSWTESNFEYVQYTPTLKNLYDEVIDPSYWEDDDNAEEYVELLKIDDTNVNNLVEQPISELKKSNMEIAFMKAIGSLWE